MPVLCFVIDTSASMNQRTASGQRIIDHAKTAVENFISKVRSKDPSARTDQYLLTTTSRDDSLRVGIKDTPTVFWHELRNIQANGLSNLGQAIQNAFDILNVERYENELDSVGRGRHPWMIKPASIIVITDGGKLTSPRHIKGEIELPGSTLPGSILIQEPFRWDQRVFSIVLKFNAQTAELNANQSAPSNVESPNSDSLAWLCDKTGGRNFTVTCPTNMMETLQTIGAKVANSAGVMIDFEKLADKNGLRPELGNTEAGKAWHKTKGMVVVRTNYKTGTFQGFWPIPESYWPDPAEPAIPPRSAHPALRFSTKDVKPHCLTNFAFDKLELETSPLTQAMLDRKRPDTCWQVFVEGSGQFAGMGKPIGYLKPNSENKLVNLFLHPYDYEVALNLIDDLFRSNLTPTPQWKNNWEEYLKNIPNYYIPHLRKALSAIRAVALIPDAFDIKLNISAQNQLKKIKTQLRAETEKMIEQVRQNRPAFHQERLIPVRQPESENADFANFTLLNKSRSNIKQPLLEAFDVQRSDILSQLSRMRAAFRQCLSAGLPLHKEHLLHEMPQGNMGNYQEYAKHVTPPLRDPDPDAVRMKHTFGNPWKRGRQASDSLDVDGFGFDGMEDRNVKHRKTEEVPKKRRRRTSSLSFREKRNRPPVSRLNCDVNCDGESTWSENGSNGDSDCDSELSIDEPMVNGEMETNGFADDVFEENGNFHPPPTKKAEYVNGNGMTPRTLSPTPCKMVYDERGFRHCATLIRKPGNQDALLVSELERLDQLDEEALAMTIRKLQLEAIRFSRYSLLQILDGFLNYRKEKNNHLLTMEEQA